MFDIGWSELFLIAAAALVIMGPKDLMVLLRTMGRYVGIIRNHANEFRTQFEDAIRESEIYDIKNEMTGFRDDVENTMHDANASVDERMSEAKRALSAAGPDTRTHLKTPADAKEPDAGQPDAQAGADAASDTKDGT